MRAKETTNFEVQLRILNGYESGFVSLLNVVFPTSLGS